MSPLTTPVQHCTGSPSFSAIRQKKRGNKRYIDWEGRNKTISVCG